MSSQSPSGSEQTPPRLTRLLAAGEPASAEEIVRELGLWERPASPPSQLRLMLNMVSSVDGRATLNGRSGGLSDRADRALFHGLRSAVDAVLVGAGTVRAERYGRLVPDQTRRRMRVERGLPAEPLACIVSARMSIAEDVPLLAEPAARVAILTASAASLPACSAQVEYIRAARHGQLDLAAALAQLRERFAVHSVLCEGGPHLAAQLLAGDHVDELFLSVSPTLAGEHPAGGEALRILAGAELDPPVELELLDALTHDSSLFLRYGVSARGRVSRETMLSSSLAS